MASSSGKAKSTLQFLGCRAAEGEREASREGRNEGELIFVCAFRTQVYAELTENMKICHAAASAMRDESCRARSARFK